MANTIEEPKVNLPDDSLEPVPIETASERKLGFGLLFGTIFGFLLQKGGVGKFHILEGQLLLVDFTVVKIMLSAVVVGMVGIHFMHQRGMVKLHIKPTRFAPNVIGGLLFGVGFALAAYCPGTGAAALGQGNFDAMAVMFGMLGGSYLFAEASGWISKNLDPIGERGKLTLHDWIPVNRTALTVGCAVLLTAILTAIEYSAAR